MDDVCSHSVVDCNEVSRDYQSQTYALLPKLLPHVQSIGRVALKNVCRCKITENMSLNVAL